MAKILVVNLPFWGHINPTLGIVTELVRRGHRVDYINSTKCKEVIESTGASLIPYKNKPDARLNIDFLMFYESYITAKEIIDQYDLLIYEMSEYLLQTLSETVGIPTVRICAQFAYNDEIVRQMIFSTLKYFPYRFKIGRKYISRIAFDRRNVKIPGIDYFDELAHHYPELNLVNTCKEFQIDGMQFDDKFKFIGPNISRKDKVDFNLKLDVFKNPIIYVSGGTVCSANKLIRMCINAFSKEKVEVIISLGKRSKKINKKMLPKNIHIFEFVPQLYVLHYSSLFITHAGMGSTNEALYFGVPLLASPVTSDQPIIANQIERLNLGKKIDIHKISDLELRNIAMSVMNDDTIKSACKQMSENMKKAGGAIEGCNLIENYLRDCINGGKYYGRLGI